MTRHIENVRFRVVRVWRMSTFAGKVLASARWPRLGKDFCQLGANYPLHYSLRVITSCVELTWAE